MPSTHKGLLLNLPAAPPGSILDKVSGCRDLTKEPHDGGRLGTQEVGVLVSRVPKREEHSHGTAGLPLLLQHLFKQAPAFPTAGRAALQA